MYKPEIQELLTEHPLEPLSAIVARYLYNQITYLQIKPGSLNISQIASDLNVLPHCSRSNYIFAFFEADPSNRIRQNASRPTQHL